MTSTSCNYCTLTESELIEMNISLVRSPNKRHRICTNCASKISIHAMKDKNFNKSPLSPDLDSFSPLSIFNHINKSVLFQDDAVKCVSLSLYQHIQRVNGSYDGKTATVSKSNVLLAGPSGSGKTAIIKTIKGMFDFPIIETNANSITSSGYSGRDSSDIIYELFVASGEDLELTEKGIIFIDEIDKIKKSNTDNDVNGIAVQESLLKIIEGTSVHLNYPEKDIDLFVDTTNILFICAGTFSGINKIHNMKNACQTIGFGSETKTKESEFDYSKLDFSDYVEYGFIEEFLGRLPILGYLAKLTKDQYKEMLIKPKDSLFSQISVLFENENSTFNYTEAAMDELAIQAMKKNLGARGAKNILSKAINNKLFEISSNAESVNLTLDFFDENFIVLENTEDKLRLVI
jgi:ATP-dependent Clp protease ATP-binding subunit ClpX